jgi:hypothetical protein
LAIPANRQRKHTSLGPETVHFASNVLKLFAEGLEGRPQGQVLDVGPTSQENLLFFASRAKRLYVCNMFLHLAECLKKERPVSQIWKHMDYPPESFDGILLWDLPDRLDDQEVGTLANLCYKILKPGGMAAVWVPGEQAALSGVNAYVIGQDFTVSLRPQTDLHLPQRSRQNREVLAMMAPLAPTKSYLCRPGIMEFLFRRD